jgi:hypothetical protein
MSDKIVKPVFRNGSHGLVMDDLWGSGMLCESFDGGITWSQVNYTGSRQHSDIDYVPGTPNTWVRSDFYDGGSGSSYSFDGGHSWTDFPGTEEIPFYPMTWLNSHCGWAGGMSKSSTEGGVYKYTGWVVPKPAPENVQAIVTGNDIDISWDPPGYDPGQMSLYGYNVRRNGTKLNSGLITGLTYTDMNVPDGEYTYCVTAQYCIGASEGACRDVEIFTEINDAGSYSCFVRVYPNPCSGTIRIETTARGRAIVLDFRGNELISQVLNEPGTEVELDNLPCGIYFIRVVNDEGVTTVKVVKI